MSWKGLVVIMSIQYAYESRIVRENIPTALILEDDADWDVLIKGQLEQFAAGTRSLQAGSPRTSTFNAVRHSPYGADWDLLWVGHCGATNRLGEDQNYYVMQNDPTVAPSTHRPWWRRHPNLTPKALHGNHTRYIYEVGHGLCSFGYAVSTRGAQKLLYSQALQGQATNFDRAIQRMCKLRNLDYRCYTAWPPLVTTHFPIGPVSATSDRVPADTAEMRTVADTPFIVYSGQLNLERILAGHNITSQWPDLTLIPEMPIDDSVIPEGEIVFVSKYEYLDGEGKPINIEPIS